MNMSLLIITTKCTSKTSTDAYYSNATLTLTLERKTRSSLKVYKWTALSVYYLFMFPAFWNLLSVNACITQRGLVLFSNLRLVGPRGAPHTHMFSCHRFDPVS